MLEIFQQISDSSTDDESLSMAEPSPCFVTVVIDPSDEIAIEMRKLGRSKKARWSDELLNRDGIKPMFPPIEILNGNFRPEGEKKKHKLSMIQSCIDRVKVIATGVEQGIGSLTDKQGEIKDIVGAYENFKSYLQEETENCAKNEAKSRGFEDLLKIENAAFTEEMKENLPLQMKL